MSRKWLIALVVAILVLVAAVLWRWQRQPPPIGKTAKASRASIERIVIASGTIQPEHLVEVRPKISGIVERFLVDAGDRVRAGQVVAEIDRETLASAVREARAVVNEAEVNRDHAAVELQRRTTLFGRGVESKDIVDRVQAEHAGAEAVVERARATLQRLEQELGYATVTAPIDGVVLRRDLNAGAAAASVASVVGGTVLMTIADTSALHVLGIIDENEIARVRVGMSARIRTETYPERVFQGRVRKIASMGDRKDNVTSFKVEVTVLEGIADMWALMSADADIITEVHDNALILPETALLYEGNSIFVEVVEPASEARLLRKAVKTGISNAERVEILEGLAEGDEVKLQ